MPLLRIRTVSIALAVTLAVLVIPLGLTLRELAHVSELADVVAVRLSPGRVYGRRLLPPSTARRSRTPRGTAAARGGTSRIGRDVRRHPRDRRRRRDHDRRVASNHSLQQGRRGDLRLVVARKPWASISTPSCPSDSVPGTTRSWMNSRAERSRRGAWDTAARSRVAVATVRSFPPRRRSRSSICRAAGVSSRPSYATSPSGAARRRTNASSPTLQRGSPHR